MEFVKLVGPVGVFFIMFALGLNLSIDKFKVVIKNFKTLIIGLICQIIVLPIIGLIIILLFDISSEFQFGIFLLLIMPSAAMSNYATRLIDGNVSLSITLTSSCALLSFLTIPLYLKFFANYIYDDVFELDLFAFSLKTFSFITIPVFIGIFCIEKFPKTFDKRRFFLDRMAFALFLIIIFIAIYMEKNSLIEYFQDVGVIITIILASIIIILSILLKIFIHDLKSRRAILVEGILQNGAMGFVIGSFIYSEVVYLVPIAIYALLQYCVLLFYIANINIKN